MKFRQEHLYGLPIVVFTTPSLKGKTFLDLDIEAFSDGSEHIYVVEKSGRVIYNSQMNVLIAATKTKDNKYYRVPIGVFREAPDYYVSYK